MEDQFGFKPQFSASAPIYPNPDHPFPPHNPAQPPYPSHNPNYPPYPAHNPNYPSYPAHNPSYPSYPTPSSGHHPPPPSHHTNQAFRWVESNAEYGTVPPTAIQGGMDADGHPIYVGRAFHEGDLIPAKVIPGKNAAYVAHHGAEHLVENFQILCRQQFDWVPSQAGHIPPGAVQGGHTSEGEPLFIGRTYHEGSQTIGKIHPSHGVCYIPFGGQEIACPEYEVLIVRV